jgi:hypothetical protein
MELDSPVKTRDELIAHIFRLLDDSDARDWENESAYSFLQAMAGWLNDCAGYYRNIQSPVDVETPTWQIIADALTAAREYE